MSWPEAKPIDYGDKYKDKIPLLTPYDMGPFHLVDRIVYAPLTRCRAIGTVPQPAAVEYYTQRARQGGFMLSEGTSPSPTGYGYPHTPGIFTKEQVEAWKPIVKAVKDKGAVFFCQLWHVGRVSHDDFQPDKQPPVAPSALRIQNGQVFTYEGAKDFSMPRELTTAEIKELVNDFAVSAKNAMEAGFDGVEVHGAHGYLIEEFLKSDTNKRTDEYGGSVENRSRFALEVMEAVVAAVGKERVGIRLSPFTKFMDSIDEYPYSTYMYLIERLNEIENLYVHMVEPRVNHFMGGGTKRDETDSLWPFRHVWHGTFISAGGHDFVSANEAIETGRADLICFGRNYLANPDLPLRFKLHAPLNKYDRATFYTQDQVKGYTDYPFLDEKLAKGAAGEAQHLIRSSLSVLAGI